MAENALNTLYYGDNLDILRHHNPVYIPDASVDLIYLDPPFNSNADYNLIFREPKSGEKSAAQLKAFTDTWTWLPTPEGDRPTARAYEDVMLRAPDTVAKMLRAMVEFIGQTDLTAYLVMMTQRLVELHRVLKPTGSLYLHCDPTASHYLKIVLDSIFGPTNFRNEIVWRRTGAHGKALRWAPVHDTILFYVKGAGYTWNRPKRPYMNGHVQQFLEQDSRGWHTKYYGNVLTGSGTRNGESGQPWLGIDPTPKDRHWAVPGALVEELLEETGIDISGLTQRQKLDRLYELGYIQLVPGEAWPIYKHYVNPAEGSPTPDLWALQPYTGGTVFGTDQGIDEDVRWLSPRDSERLGYATQKPLALLERIIAASSNPGDVVLDPFCGCGTAVCAAQKLGRRWIGIDVTHLAITVMKSRLKDMFGLDAGKDYAVVGEPRDLAGARQLARDDRYQFQYWAVSLLEATPQDVETQRKKGADKGIDGIIPFIDGPHRQRETIVIQVKSGHVTSSHVRDLKGVMEREKAALGLYICLDPPTRDMLAEEANAGFYTSTLWPGRHGDHRWPRIQIRTIEQLFAGHGFELPTRPVQFKQAARSEQSPEALTGNLWATDGGEPDEGDEGDGDEE